MEIEIKAKVHNISSFRKQVLNLGAKKICDKHQIDIYLSPPDKSFFDQEKYYLRVREDKISKKSRLEYHIFHKSKDGHGVSEETELDVSSARTLLKIFKKLKFLEVSIIDKKR